MHMVYGMCNGFFQMNSIVFVMVMLQRFTVVQPMAPNLCKIDNI